MGLPLEVGQKYRGDTEQLIHGASVEAGGDGEWEKKHGKPK